MPGRKKKPVDLASLSEEERARRAHQAAQREKALAARSGGEKFVSEAKKRRPLERRRFEKRKTERKAENASKRRAAQKESKKSKASAPDIVIVPIFWKGEAKQMARVLSACADAEAALADCGKRVLLDAGHTYTPGQKFAHWEHRGVQLRVEIGPREAEKKNCTLARTFSPGEPAHRVQKVAVDGSLWSELAKLAAMTSGDGWAEGAADDGPGGADESAQQQAARRAHELQQAREHEEAATRGAAGGARRGGDDLEENYEAWGAGRDGEAEASGGEAGEDADEDERRTQKKAKKAKKRAAAEAEEGKPKKRSKAEKEAKQAKKKVVSF